MKQSKWWEEYLNLPKRRYLKCVSLSVDFICPGSFLNTVHAADKQTTYTENYSEYFENTKAFMLIVNCDI